MTTSLTRPPLCHIEVQGAGLFSLSVDLADTMLSPRQLSSNYVTSFSIVVALFSLTLTVVPFRKSPETIERTSIRVFNVATNSGLRDATLLTLRTDSWTNRTIWETVSTPEVQAGLERVEPSAWIPPHSHTTDEILLVYAGRGEAYDENGHIMELSPGSMIHVHRGARHAFRNVGKEPLWLMWSLLRKSGREIFEFQQTYAEI